MEEEGFGVGWEGGKNLWENQGREGCWGEIALREKCEQKWGKKRERHR